MLIFYLFKKTLEALVQDLICDDQSHRRPSGPFYSQATRHHVFIYFNPFTDFYYRKTKDQSSPVARFGGVARLTSLSGCTA